MSPFLTSPKAYIQPGKFYPSSDGFKHSCFLISPVNREYPVFLSTLFIPVSGFWRLEQTHFDLKTTKSSKFSKKSLSLHPKPWTQMKLILAERGTHTSSHPPHCCLVTAHLPTPKHKTLFGWPLSPAQFCQAQFWAGNILANKVQGQNENFAKTTTERQKREAYVWWGITNDCTSQVLTPSITST